MTGLSGGGEVRRALREYLPELIYGSTDGIITTFAIVAGVVGARLATEVVLILGFASLLADGFSMAASNFLSERSRPDDHAPWTMAAKRAGATFSGFVVIGAVPLTAYLLPIALEARFEVAVSITLLTLFVVGAGRALAAERIHWLRGGIEMLVVGAMASGVAFLIGGLLADLGGGFGA